MKTSPFVLLLLLLAALIGCTTGCTARFFTRLLQNEPTALIVIGGTVPINGSTTDSIGTPTVEVITNEGHCGGHRLKLPVALCHHQAVLVTLEEKIVVCGGYKNVSCSATPPGNYSTHCFVWKKADGAFRPLDNYVSRLPHAELQQLQLHFDFQYVEDKTLYYRPWSMHEFWKGTVEIDDKMVWNRRANFPLNTKHGCALVFRDHLHLLGGLWTDASGTDRATPAHFRYIEDHHQEVGWQALPSLPRPVYNIKCLPVSDNGILVLGGTVTDDTQPLITAKAVYFWDAKTNKWDASGNKTFAPLSQVRTEFSVASMQTDSGRSRLFALGGIDTMSSPKFPHYLSSIEEYDPYNDEWTWPKFSLSEPKADMAVVSVPQSWIPECFGHSHHSKHY